MCEKVLILSIAAFASAQHFQHGRFNDHFAHPRSFGSRFDGDRFGENQFGLERRDVRYRNNNDWNANRDGSFEQDYPYRPEYDTRYDNGYGNDFNPNFQRNGNTGQSSYDVQRRRSHNFESENFDEQSFNSRNTENQYRKNIENKYKDVNLNLNSRFDSVGQNYHHQQTEFRSAVEKERRQRNNEFFNEENTAFKTYIRKESGDGRNFDSENIDVLAQITTENAESNKSARLVKHVNNHDQEIEHDDSRYQHNRTESLHNNTKPVHDNVTLTNSEQTSTLGNITKQTHNFDNETINLNQNEAAKNTTNSSKESERNKKTDDVWVWDVDNANITTPRTALTPDLDDRAAFDGGKCASGQVKVGGVCVDVD